MYDEQVRCLLSTVEEVSAKLHSITPYDLMVDPFMLQELHQSLDTALHTVDNQSCPAYLTRQCATLATYIYRNGIHPFYWIVYILEELDYVYQENDEEEKFEDILEMLASNIRQRIGSGSW